jgi:hypothetical protein
LPFWFWRDVELKSKFQVLVSHRNTLNIKKVAPLKENELQRWSHLDIVNDTIPE